MRWKEINEIYKNTDQPVVISNEPKNHNLLNKISIPNSDFISITEFKDFSHDEIGIYYKDSMIGFIKFDDSFGVRQTDQIYIEPQYQNKGIMSKVIDWVANKGDIYSSGNQSPSAQGLWKSLIKNTNKVFVFDIINNTEYPAKDVPYSDIWNNKSNPILRYKK